MPRTKKRPQTSRAFEPLPLVPEEWLSPELPLLCEAVRLKPYSDPWERHGKIVRADGCTETRRRRLQELSLNVEPFVDDECGAAAI